MNLYIVPLIFFVVAVFLLVRAYFYKRKNNLDSAFIYAAIGVLVLIFSIMGFFKFKNYYVIAAVIIVYYVIIAVHDAKKKKRAREQSNTNIKYAKNIKKKKGSKS